MTYVLYAPDPTFTGMCSGIPFTDGVGHCESAFMAGWLSAKGFAIDPAASAPGAPLPDAAALDAMSAPELAELARERGISLEGVPVGNKAVLMERIRSAE